MMRGGNSPFLINIIQLPCNLVRPPEPTNMTNNFETITHSDGNRQYNTTHHSYPSVTTVIRATESKMKREKLKKWIHKMNQIHGIEESEQLQQERLNQGKETHRLIEQYIKGEINALPDDPFLDKARNFLNLFRQDHIGVEHFITCDSPYPYAGTIDLLAPFNNQLSVIDWTTTQQLKMKHWLRHKFLQCTAYALACQAQGYDVEQVIIIVLTHNRPQLFTDAVSTYRNEWEERLFRFYDEELWYDIGLSLDTSSVSL